MRSNGGTLHPYKQYLQQINQLTLDSEQCQQTKHLEIETESTAVRAHINSGVHPMQFSFVDTPAKTVNQWTCSFGTPRITNEISSGNSGAKAQDLIGPTLGQSEHHEQVRVEEARDILVDFH